MWDWLDVQHNITQVAFYDIFHDVSNNYPPQTVDLSHCVLRFNEPKISYPSLEKADTFEAMTGQNRMLLYVSCLLFAHEWTTL